MTLPALKQPPQRYRSPSSCWYFKIFNIHMAAMLLPVVVPLLLLQMMMMSSYVNAQDYYFSNPNTQNRFVPSSQYQNTRPYSTRSAGAGSGGSQPGSYQEQILFLGNEGGKQTQSQPLTSAAYTPFGQQYTNNRNNDYYDISPRPFGVAGTGSGSSSSLNSYTRSKSFKPSSSLAQTQNGFVPQRVNAPHQQQTQFVQQFNEQTVDKPSSSNRLSASTGFGTSAARPFGNGGFSPNSNRNRPVAASYNSDAPVGPQAQQQVPFRNTRNRFQPSTATATTTTTTSTELPTSKRFNRFGGGRTQNFAPSGARPATQTTTQSNNPELSRVPNKTSGRRPAFISREVNEPIQINKPQKPFSVKSGRVKLPLKDKLLKQQIAASSTPFKPSLSVVPLKENDSLSDEYDEEDNHEENQLEHKEVKEPILEKLQLHEAEVKPPIPEIDSKLIESIVTTVNSMLEATAEKEEVVAQNSANASQSEEIQKAEDKEDDVKEDETDDSNYSDEYSQEGEGGSKEANTEQPQEEIHTTEKPAEYDEEYHEESEEELKATVMPVTEATPAKLEELPMTTESSVPVEQEKITATVLTTTTEASGEKDEEHNEEESSADYEDEEYEDEESGDDVEEDEEENGHHEDHEEGSAHTLQNMEEVIATTAIILEPSPEILDREVISVVTTKSVVNGSTAFPSPVTPRSTTLSMEEEAIFTETKVSPASDETQEEKDLVTTPKTIQPNEESLNNATEGYVVVASIQTSRSINGARFLPFPAIQQDESKKSLSELERNAKTKERNAKNNQDSASEQTNESAELEVTTTALPESSSENTTSAQASSSTESIIDKLDRVQSELSSGLLNGKYPIISQMDVSTPATTSTSGNRFAPNIRKFQPKTTPAPKVRVHHYDETAAPKVKVHHFDETEMDELASLLPDGFKKSSYKNRKITTTTTSTTKKPEQEIEFKKPLRNSTIGRSFKNTPVAQDVSLAGLLPKGYKLPSTTEKPILEDILSKIKFDENLDKLLPKDYKDKASTAKPPVTLVDDLSKFLPPGYKITTTPKTPTTSEETKKSVEEGVKDKESTALAGIPVVEPEDISKFLPPGYKLRTTRKPIAKPEPETIDISQLLPKGYKPSETKDIEPADIFKKLDIKEVASLLPPGFKLNSTDEKTTTTNTIKHPASTTTTSTTEHPAEDTGNSSSSSSSSGYKVVFPKGIHKRLGSHRLTTPRSTDSEENIPGSPPVVVRKGPPMRATTEFTGWPTPSTTPISIEKLLEQARTATIDFEDLLMSSTTSSTTTSTTTTTTTTTPKPTKPGFCTSDCDLAATIKIIDGVSWKPELLDHNTAEWKNLAREVEAQLNEVYSTAPQLSKWYKKVRIDSFSQGSVLVDYYVELANITNDVNTLEIKKLFHEALTPQPIFPQKPEIENETDNEEDNSYQDIKEEKLVKETFIMGKYIIDPVATDFSVIPKSLTPQVEFAEEDLLIPQWAIVVIVIGVGSLVFVVIFGITVLLNRQNRAKKTPIPLTSDMLNELKINHMGGADNYGVDDFYNIDDAWNDTKQPIKPKRFTNSMNDSSGSNIYDSWRSTRQNGGGGDYYYDSQNNFSSQKGDSLQRSLKHHPQSQYSGSQHQQQQHHHHQQQQHQHQLQQQQQHQQSLYGGHHQYPDAFADAHQMYTYNNQTNSRSSRYPRDYDPDF